MSAARCSQEKCPGRLFADELLQLVPAWRDGGMEVNDLGKLEDLLKRYPSAVVRFYWPTADGKGRDVCEQCAMVARRVAETLGFKLREESIVTGEEVGAPSRWGMLEL